MYQYNLNEDQFWKQSPAAPEIFEYQHDNQELNQSAWGFDKGSISIDRHYTWAHFSSITDKNWDELIISATMKPDGSWQMKHLIKHIS